MNIYHQLPPTCFGVCCTIVRQTTALIAKRTVCFLQSWYKMYNIPCSLNLHCCYIVELNTYFFILYYVVRVIKSRRMRWAGHVARMGEERGVNRILLMKPEGRRPVGRPRRRWVDNIRMDLQEVGCGYMDWIGLTQDRDRWRTLVSAVLNLRVR